MEITSTFSGSVIVVRLSHPEKALSSILVTLSGIVIFFSFLQSLNALQPIDFSVLGRFTVIKLEQPLKELSSIFVTPSGKVTLFIVLQS